MLSGQSFNVQPKAQILKTIKKKLYLSGSGGEYDYEGSGGDYPDAGGLPKKFDQCYNSYGTQKTIRYAKVYFYPYII